MEPQKIYEKVKARQTKMKLSNRGLCRLAGVSHSALDNWRNRNILPTVPVLEGFCDALGLSLAALFTDIETDELSEFQIYLLELCDRLPYSLQNAVISIVENIVAMREKTGK